MDIPSDPLLTRILLDVRLPRVLLALSGGASLAAAGFVFQMLFANPLVEPGFLGVSQGAAFGAAGAMVFLGSVPAVVQISAMSGGCSPCSCPAGLPAASGSADGYFG
jgi:iron complex transport system permease protein